MATTDLVDLAGVAKQFFRNGKPLLACRDVSLRVRRGEFVAIVGPSGCGKSTLLNMLAGLMKPSAGTVVYDGKPVADVNHRVGYMTQRDNLLPWRSVENNIGIALEIARVQGR